MQIDLTISIPIFVSLVSNLQMEHVVVSYVNPLRTALNTSVHWSDIASNADTSGNLCTVFCCNFEAVNLWSINKPLIRAERDGSWAVAGKRICFFNIKRESIPVLNPNSILINESMSLTTSPTAIARWTLGALINCSWIIRRALQSEVHLVIRTPVPTIWGDLESLDFDPLSTTC